MTSLRWKFTAVIAAATTMSAILATAGFSLRDWNRFSERTSYEVSVLARVVASQLGAAVMLQDARAAAEIAGALRTDQRITRATVYDQAGKCLAVFTRTPSSACPARGDDGITTTNDSLAVTRAILAGDERVGTLSIAAEVTTFTEVTRQYIAGSALVIAISLIVSAILAVILQGRVTAPILMIADAARQISRTHAFTKPVPVTSSDEVGELAEAFNSMGRELTAREKELALRRSQLEMEVAERSRVNEELQRAKERAETLARMKAEFLANMSHEIRTPLNGVTGMIELAFAASEDEEVCEQLSFARTAAHSLTAIVNDILDFSKIEAGKMTLESVNLDLSALLRDCLQLFMVTAREKNLSLGYTIDERCSRWLRGDPVRLRQVLVNLTGNAMKFTSSGSVHISAFPSRNDCICFEVRDTGIGIEQEKLQAIFEPFTQADGSHTRRFGGSGLGLAITQRLVTLMGGRIWAESEPGKGSRFFVDLPLPRGQEETSMPSSLPNPDLPVLSVLVAEDNMVNQKVISGILKRYRWSVTLVSDGRMAVDAFRRDTFDLIMMDVQMPEVDGLEATTAIRQEEQRRALKRTPILALTAHASPSQHAACISCGMDGVVVKPIDVSCLVAEVRRVITVQEAAAAGSRT